MASFRSVNKVILVGNLTRDGEIGYTPSGTPVCSFTVATNESWKDAKGELHEEASFHNVNAWGKFGESLSKMLQKGMKVYVEGNLTYREKRDEAGKIISRDTRIRADSVLMLDRSNRPHDEMDQSQGDNTPKKAGGDFDLDSIAHGLDEAKSASKPAAAPAPISDDDLPF